MLSPVHLPKKFHRAFFSQFCTRDLKHDLKPFSQLESGGMATVLISENLLIFFFADWAAANGGVTNLRDRKSLSIAKSHPTLSRELPEKFGPSIRTMKGFGKSYRKNSPPKLDPNFAQNLGRQILEIPSQQEKINAHSFVFGPELWIQYTYTYVNNSEHHRFWIRYTYLAPFAFIYLVIDTNTHMWKIFLANEFKFNTNTYTSKNRREFKM